MRSALVLCFLLVACRNESDERLKNVEKELAELKANPPVERVTVPAPATVVPAMPGDLTHEEAEKLVGPNAAFVSTKTEADLGFYGIFDRQVCLYRHTESGKYNLAAIMSDYRGMAGSIEVSENDLDQMRDFLTRNAHPHTAIHKEHPLPEAGVENLFRLHLAAFVPTKDDPYAGAILQTHPDVVYLYRFASGFYVPVTQVDEKVVAADGTISVSEEQMRRLQDKLSEGRP